MSEAEGIGILFILLFAVPCLSAWHGWTIRDLEKKAAALSQSSTEMEARIQMLEDMGVRTLGDGK